MLQGAGRLAPLGAMVPNPVIRIGVGAGIFGFGGVGFDRFRFVGMQIRCTLTRRF